MAASEERPLGMTIPPAAAGVEIPPEPPDVAARALTVASRMLCGATTFFFVAFVFAYFYLRSINQNHMWRPAHVKPEQGLGVAFIACLLLSVALTILAGRAMKAKSRRLGRARRRRRAGWGSPRSRCSASPTPELPFGPTDGAYASVYCAWTGFYLIAMLATMYWLETQIATELRARRAPAAGGGGRRRPRSG